MTEFDDLLTSVLGGRGHDLSTFDDDTDLIVAGLLDSLALVEILAFLDERVVIGDDVGLDELRTPGLIRSLLEDAPQR